MNNNYLIFRLNILLAIFLILLFVGTATAQITAIQAQEKAREQFLITSAQFVADKDRAKAREGYLEAIKLYPAYPQPRYNLAVLAEADENWDGAIKWFTDFLRFDTKSSYATKARVELTKLNKVKIQDSTPEGKKNRQYNETIFTARGLVNMGLAKEAVAEAAQAVKIDDRRWEAYALTANILAGQKQDIDAAMFYQQAIDRAPTNKKSALQRALTDIPKEKQYRTFGQAGAQALKARKYREAGDDFITAWRIFPNRDEYGLDAAVAFTIAGDKDKAEALLTMLEQGASVATAKKIKEIRAKMSK